jgi:hypothetical protein
MNIESSFHINHAAVPQSAYSYTGVSRSLFVCMVFSSTSAQKAISARILSICERCCQSGLNYVERIISFQVGDELKQTEVVAVKIQERKTVDMVRSCDLTRLNLKTAILHIGGTEAKYEEDDRGSGSTNKDRPGKSDDLVGYF